MPVGVGGGRIVIVGGGVAGLELATRLARRHHGRGDTAVTLVDRSLSHAWKPMLHTFAAGTDRPERQKVDFLAQAKARDFRFWPGRLVGVDRSARRVRLVPDAGAPAGPGEFDGDTIGYDTLVLAVGSRANSFGTPGVAEHCLTIDDLATAETFRAHMRRQVFTSILERGELHVAIVGGGPTGVELAAELVRSIGLVSSYAAPALRRHFRISLLDQGPRLLGTFPEQVGEDAARLLSGLGVEVRLGVGVKSVDGQGFLLADGSRIDAGLKVWAAGVKAPEVLASIEGLELSRTGQLVVTPTLQTTHDPAVFALGDCASFDNPATGRGLPATAQVAHQQAAYLSRHLGRKASGDIPPFRYRDLGSIVALGEFGGWGTVGRFAFGGRRLQGAAARLGHLLLYRQHQVVLLGPFRAAVAVVIDVLDRFVTPEVRLDT